jgi:hypothetical protein
MIACSRFCVFALILLGQFALATGPAAPVAAERPPTASETAPLTTEQVVHKLQERNLARASALHEFAGTRIYTMQYRGLPGNRDAEMVVSMTYRSPDKKQFTVVSQTGSKFLVDHVFKKLLEGELEATSEENRRRTALNEENYQFKLTGYENSPQGGSYVLEVNPKSRSKFVYRGKIWVDAKEFAVTRIEVEPAKNPSFWIKKTEIQHRYTKVGNFWFPEEDHSESMIRLGGRATLKIEYKDYRILEAGPINEIPSSPAALAQASAGR